MNRTMLIACVALAGLAAGTAQATTHHRHAAGQSAGAYAEPKQPIAYTSVQAYLKASPKQRETRDWSLAAATGSSVNTSAALAPPAPPNTGAADSGMTNETPGTAPTPPTESPDTAAAPLQPPLNSTSSQTNAQPPASNAPVTQQPANPQ
ncbi:MAG TPA: hypothetical protein VKU90_00660 [Caulobacteraceae bacterium]|nr:hypothetical protein [Caulobacteraceae bacterium]